MPVLPRILHAVDVTKTSERHKRMQASWDAIYAKGVTPVHIKNWGRTADKTLGDPRPLPYLKELLMYAVAQSKRTNDVILWTNADNGLLPAVVEWSGHWVPRFGAITMRRDEEGHVGRDLFAFTAGWLTDNWDDIPDYLLGASDFDLGIACFVRRFHKIDTPNLDSLRRDIQPADSNQRYVTHEPHRSEWLTSDVNERPSTKHNRKCFMDWARKNQPNLKFNGAGVII